MFAVEDTAHLPGSAYAPAVTRDVYERLGGKARRALRAGHAVALDATFSTAAERKAARGVAAEVGVAFDGLFLDPPRLKTRLARRLGLAAPTRRMRTRRWRAPQRAEPLGRKGMEPARSGLRTLGETTSLRGRPARERIDAGETLDRWSGS